MPAALFELALPRFVEVGWLSTEVVAGTEDTPHVTGPTADRQPTDSDVALKGKERKRKERKGREENSMSSSPVGDPDRSALTTQVDTVLEHYRGHHPRSRPGDKERRLVLARLKEGYSLADLCQAIDGCHRSPHHCGQNDQGTKYQSLDLIVRDASHVQQFMETPEHPEGSQHRPSPSIIDRISTLGKGDTDK
jgi:hypothetical protein